MGNTGKGKQGKIPAGETAMFCAQVSLILKAGIPIYDGMETLCESIEDEKSQEAFRKISNIVNETGSLYKAVETVGFFPDYMVNMIHIGEEAGKLDDVLESLSKYYERENSVKKAVQSAVMYPMILILMMSVVIAVLVGKVMPVFEQVFENLGTQMSASGRAIMSFGMAAGKVALVLTILLLILVIAVYIFSKTSQGEKKLGDIYGKIPFLKVLNTKIAASRFASVISMMLSSGYELEHALEMAPDIVSDSLAKAKIEECGELVKDGVAFPEALTRIQLFSLLHARMIHVGFKAGQMDSVMQRLAKIYEEEVNEAIARLVSFIEPTLVAVLSEVIGGILVSVMLPLASIMSSIG